MTADEYLKKLGIDGFFATRAGTPERKHEEAIALERGLRLGELKSQVVAMGLAHLETPAKKGPPPEGT